MHLNTNKAQQNSGLHGGARAPARAGLLLGPLQVLGKGQNGVSTKGVTAIFMFFDRGTFWVLPLTYCCLPESARAYLFPQSVKNNDFRSGPVSVDPICPQPRYFCNITVNTYVGEDVHAIHCRQRARKCRRPSYLPGTSGTRTARRSCPARPRRRLDGQNNNERHKTTKKQMMS